MELLKQRILTDGATEGNDVIKVDSFLNHQLDVDLLNEIGKEFKRRFEGTEITKILTIEASGIGIACIVAQYFNVPVVFAKKSESRNLDKEVYESKVYSFTKQKEYTVKVSKKYINEDDKLLLIDDFMANGDAAIGLCDIILQSGGSLQGIGIVIEKGFQDGGRMLRESGVRVESLAVIEAINNGKIIFKE